MKRQSYALRDGTLSALHFGDMSEPVRLVFLHANGFNAQIYRSVLAPLDVHCIGFDMRGHGYSRGLPQPLNIKNWDLFRKDCVEFFDQHLPKLTDEPVVLAGHSLGAATAIMAAPDLKDRLSGYVGFDPVSIPYIFRLTTALPGGQAYMKRRVPIIRHAGSDGIWELACDPKWEQVIYTAQQQNVFKAARHLPDNSTLLYAGGRSSISTKGSRRAMQKAQPNMNVEFDKDLRHLFPFIQTDRASEVLDKVIRTSRK